MVWVFVEAITKSESCCFQATFPHVIFVIPINKHTFLLTFCGLCVGLKSKDRLKDDFLQNHLGQCFLRCSFNCGIVDSCCLQRWHLRGSLRSSELWSFTVTFPLLLTISITS